MAAFTMAYTVSIIFPLLYCLLQGSISEDGVCGDRCCSGYREVGEKCVECIGSYSENCMAQCPPNYYGGRCLSRCFCDINERCDPVYGCCPKTIMKCQQPGYTTEKGVHDENRYQMSTKDYATEKEVHVEDDSSSVTLTGILISVSVTILMLSCLVSSYVWIRQERRMTKAKPKSAKEHGESNATTRNVKESSDDDIRESHMIVDENITTL